MDSTNLMSVAGMSVQGAQQVQGHHHHKMSMSQRIDKMETAIDQAAKDGKLSSDQATDMKKQLDDIKTTLASAQSSNTPLTSDQKQQIHKEMQSIGKDLFAAIAPAQDAAPTSQSAAADLFAKLDANGDGSIDKNEFATFVDQLKNSGSAAYAAPSSYNQQGTLTISTMQQSTISLTA